MKFLTQTGVFGVLLIIGAVGSYFIQFPHGVLCYIPWGIWCILYISNTLDSVGE